MSTATKTAKATIETTWMGWLETPTPPFKGLSEINYPAPIGGHRSLVSLSGDTMADLIRNIHRSATYYHSLGYKLFAANLTRVCKACGGAGSTAVRITKACPAGERRCKACRGIGTFETIPDFELEASSNVRIVQP